MTYTYPFIQRAARAGLPFPREMLEHALTTMMPDGLTVPAGPERKPADAYAWQAIVQLTIDTAERDGGATLVTSSGRMFLAPGRVFPPVPFVAQGMTWVNIPDSRQCDHAGTDLDCDCDTIAAEMAGND